MSTTKNTTRKPAKSNGQKNGQPTPEQQALAEAIAYEDAIRVDAEKLRGEATDLDAALFLKLWPLLRRPIPAGFIVSTPKSEGKPYPSTGVKSLQVLIDRVDNVLTPLHWRYEVDYVGPDGLDNRGRPARGKLARARVFVGNRAGCGLPGAVPPLLVRESHGGVNEASTIGNLFKGTETNAAKRAIAQVGPAHEIYVGAADFDPDVDPDAAKAQAKAQETSEPAERKLPQDAADRLLKIVQEAGLEDHLEAKLRAFGAKSLTDLTIEQGLKVHEWAGKAGGAS